MDPRKSILNILQVLASGPLQKIQNQHFQVQKSPRWQCKHSWIFGMGFYSIFWQMNYRNWTIINWYLWIFLLNFIGKFLTFQSGGHTGWLSGFFCSPDISQGGPKNVPVVKPKIKSVDKKKRFYNIDTYLLPVSSCIPRRQKRSQSQRISGIKGMFIIWKM